MIGFFRTNRIKAVLECFEIGLLIKWIRGIETTWGYLTKLHIFLDIKYILTRLILSHLTIRGLQKHSLLLYSLLHVTLNLIRHFVLASNWAFHINQCYVSTWYTTLALIFIFLNPLWVISFIKILTLFFFVWLFYLLFCLS